MPKKASSKKSTAKNVKAPPVEAPETVDNPEKSAPVRMRNSGL